MKNPVILHLDSEQLSCLLISLRYTRKQFQILAESKNAPIDLRFIDSLSDLILYVETSKACSKLSK